MKNLTGIIRKTYTLDKSIGQGGEAEVYAISKPADMAAKIYKKGKGNEKKLMAMIKDPPEQPKTHTAIAWPEDIVYEKGKFVGFVMKRIDDYVPIFKFYNPSYRNRHYPKFNWKYLHNTAYNLSIAVDAVHGKNHIIGDFNERNILTNTQTLVTIVDADSFQIFGSNGNVFRCPVGTSEFTPPELQDVNFTTVNRNIESDLFALSVMIFKLLMEGRHPFDATPCSQVSIRNVNIHCIKKGIFPYEMSHSTDFMKPDKNPLFTDLHPELQDLFVQCFCDGFKAPWKRPSARQWINAITTAKDALVKCRRNSQHRFSSHLNDCPWCRTNASTSKNKPQPAGVQIPLPPPFLNSPLSTSAQKSYKFTTPGPTSIVKKKKPSRFAFTRKTNINRTPVSLFHIPVWILACVMGSLTGLTIFHFSLITVESIYFSWALFGACLGIFQYLFINWRIGLSFRWIFCSIAAWALILPVTKQTSTFVSLWQISDILKISNFPLEAVEILSFAVLLAIIQLLALGRKVAHPVIWTAGTSISLVIAVSVAHYMMPHLFHSIPANYRSELSWLLLKIIYWTTVSMIYGLMTGVLFRWTLQK